MVAPSPNSLVESKCITNDLPLSDNVEQMVGMVLLGDWRGFTEQAILGADGPANPVQFLPLSTWISPSNQWAFEDKRVDGAITEVTIMNLHTGQETKTLFEPGLVLHGGIIQWLNETTLFTFLPNEDPYWEGEIYYLFLWDVVTNQQITKTIRLEHIVPPIFYHLNPVVDPQQQYIVYLCSECLAGKEGYVVKELETGETQWVIPLESKPEIPNRGTPVWSPNGQYVAVTSGPSLNEILIYNRQGKEVDRIVLPTDISVTSFVHNWSPDGKYLTFVRALDGVEGWALAYYSLESKHIIDLCISNSWLYWSPGGTKFAFTQIIGDEKIVRIVDAATSEITSFDGMGFTLAGWINLPVVP